MRSNSAPCIWIQLHPPDLDPTPPPGSCVLQRGATAAAPPYGIEELLQRLTEVSIRQQQIVEHIAACQGETERELAAICDSAAQRVPLPDPRIQATQLLPKMSANDDVESFLQMFENVATREGWSRDEWAQLLAPLLTGEAQRTYFAIPAEMSDRYDELKQEILARVGLSPICTAQLFHDWEYMPWLPARAQAGELTRLAQHWLLSGGPNASQVEEHVVIWDAESHHHRELVEAIELAEVTQQRKAGERAPPFPRRVVQERPAPEGISRPVSRKVAPGPQDEPMPTDPPRSPLRAWLTGCIVHRNPPAEAPRMEVKINGRPFQALLDSGSAVSLVHPTVFTASPLIPLPIIEVPFERIGMDLVGPLPKSARGHEHILVIVDYATRYPEAMPLRKATAKAIAQELFLLFSRASQRRY
ncbi:hypothetical protein QQF64_023875 [Cirrhinus molitorella]|uniref:Integrase catalytic domain-containing protein n=1 Tax=Cirrhinus molitorella TaxID=172907 RepID=A0ABR3NJK1_9TELE